MSITLRTDNLPRDILAERTLRDGSFALKLVFTRGPTGRILARAETPTGEVIAEGDTLEEANAEAVRALTVVMEDWLLALWGAAPFNAIRNGVSLLINAQDSEDIHADVQRVIDLLAHALPSVSAPQPLSGPVRASDGRLDRAGVTRLLRELAAKRGPLTADQVAKQLPMRLTRLTPDAPTVIFDGLGVLIIQVDQDSAPTLWWPVVSGVESWAEYGAADLSTDGTMVSEDYQLELLV